MGRPSKYTLKLSDRILDRITNGETLRSICALQDMPARKTVCEWLNKHEEFRNQYSLARVLQAEYLAEEILEIADNANEDNVKTAKLKIDARKWFASKVQPKRFGERIMQDLNVESTSSTHEDRLKLTYQRMANVFGENSQPS